MDHLYAGIGVALGFLVGLLGHEAVTARVATSLGDRTPRLMGRLSLSPQAHIDPLGSVILPVVFILAAVFSSILRVPLVFGWAKPHAMSPSSFRNPKRDVILVSLSGPLFTLVMAMLCGAVVRSQVGALSISPTGFIALHAMIVFVYLTIVELLPIPGRDGGRILQRFLSPQAAMKMEDLTQYAVAFLLVLFLFLGFIVRGMGESLCRAVTGGTVGC